MNRLASRAGRLGGFSVTEEATAHKLAKAFSKILGTYVDPYTLRIYPARGYWTHDHQDVQRFTGSFPRPDLPKLTYDFGSWNLTISSLAKGRPFKVVDGRSYRWIDNDFQIETP